MSSGYLSEISDGEYVRLRRRALGLTQAQLAEKSGVPQPNISLIERGKLAVSPILEARLGPALYQRPSAIVPVQRTALRRVLASHGIDHPRLFGSVARQTDDYDSDVDILGVTDMALSLADKFAIETELERILATPVDLVIETTNNRSFLAQACDDAVEL